MVNYPSISLYFTQWLMRLPYVAYHVPALIRPVFLTSPSRVLDRDAQVEILPDHMGSILSFEGKRTKGFLGLPHYLLNSLRILVDARVRVDKRTRVFVPANQHRHFIGSWAYNLERLIHLYSTLWHIYDSSAWA